jgi:hypothetical protein
VPRKNPETKFKEKVQEDLKTLPDCYFTKIQQVAIRGIPDILLCVNGRFVGMELKVDSEISALQLYNLMKIQEANGVAIIATPKNWKIIFPLLKEKKWNQITRLYSRTKT